MTAARSPRARSATAAASARSRPRPSARPLPQESAGPRLRHIARSTGRSREIGWRATVVFCVLGSFAALVASVAIQSQRIALQEEADRLVERTAEARDHNRDLRIAVIQAESPEHVLEVARAQGLVEPGPIAVVPAVTSPPSAEVSSPTGADPAPSEPSPTAPSSTEPSPSGSDPAPSTITPAAPDGAAR